jgi:chromosome segregation protein
VAARAAVAAARATMLARRSAHDDARREAEARARRRQTIAREVADWRRRRDEAGQRTAALDAQRDQTEAALAAARAVPDGIAATLAALAEAGAQADARAAAAADALAAAEAALHRAQADERATERAAGQAREGRAAAQARAEAAGAAVAAAAERIAASAAGATPRALAEGLGAALPADLPETPALEAEVARLQRARDALGAVNLRADEDARAVQAEHDTLMRDKQDLEQAIAKLRGGIGALNREGRERLMAAFAQVNANFTTLFQTLFGGGEARLTLVESDDPLEAGLEILCQPPGKRLTTLSLLSGGEQTLTALALIFAVFLANPAPLCVLDEVDAPLDDANVTRFCDLLDAMTRRTETRFLIITHHAVTMSRMDRLFGVTMAEQGVSQLVSVDLRDAAALAA